VEPVTGPSTRLRWTPVGWLIRDRNVGRTRVGARSLPALAGRLQAEAALHGDRAAGQDPTVGLRRPGHRPDPRAPSAGGAGGRSRAPRPRPGWGLGRVSDRAAAKAKTQLNVALTHLDEAARLAREAGLHPLTDTLERLAGDATETLAELQAVPKPTAPVEPAAGNDEQGAAS
jgi:hypothetical protein